MKEKDFKFWVPLSDISKAKDAQGNDVMRVGGIASTSAEDADGEFLDPNGFDVSYFLKSGFLNYHHQAKNDPNAIIGEPTLAEIRKDGLYIEGFLYPDNPIAQAVYNTANTLKKNSSSRSLGFSIEGKALDRDLTNPKIIKKAAITGCAITFMPKNPKTYMDLIKGGFDDDYSDEYDDDTEKLVKDLSAGITTGIETQDVAEAGSGAPLKLEDVDGATKGKKKKPTSVDFKNANGGESDEEDEEADVSSLDDTGLTKAEVYEEIFRKKTAITINEAERLYNIIQKSIMTKGKENIEKSDVSQALDMLEKAEAEVSSTDNAVVEENTEDLVKSYEAKKLELDELQKSLVEKGLIKTEGSEKGVEDSDEDEEDEEEVEGDEDMKKGFDALTDLIVEKNSAVGHILKSLYDEVISLKEISSTILKENGDLKKALGDSSEYLSGLQNTVDDLSKSLDGQPLHSRKSTVVATPYRERNFAANDQLEKGFNKNVVPLTDRKRVLEILDKATFEKGYDAEYGAAMTAFESGLGVNHNVILRLQAEKQITLQ